MKTRVENPELKPQIEAFAIEQLEACELFVSVYGKGYAREKLARNFKILYTEESNRFAAGEYVLGSSGAMTLFMKGSNGNLLTFEDIKNSKNLQTPLHESVHAIFGRTPEECKKFKICCGSGIHEVYDNGEIGRGLNEGYTNWVCEKAGFTSITYPTLTNLVRILELSVGDENVMKFGKGDITNNFPQLLGMNLDDVCCFLAKADSIYDYEHKAQDYGSISAILKRKKEFEKNKEKDADMQMPENLKKEIQKLNNIPLYKNITNDSDYIAYTQENNLNSELEDSKLKYFEHMKKLYLKKSKEIDHELIAEIISRYFIEELREGLATNCFSSEQYKKFFKLYSLMNITSKTQNNELQMFRNEIKTLKETFFENVEKDISLSIENGTLSVEQLSNYRDILSSADQSDIFYFEDLLAIQMLPENPFAYSCLFDNLSEHNNISEIFNYRIFRLENQSGEKTNLYFNTKNNNHFSQYIQTPKVFNAGDEISEDEQLFEISLTELQSMQEIVRNFLVLKQQISTENPNTKIQIVDHVVISQIDGEEPIFYLIDGNEFVRAKTKELKPHNMQLNTNYKTVTNNFKKTTPLNLETTNIAAFEEDTQSQDIEENNLKPIAQNPFKRIFQEIKRRFFRYKPAIATNNVALSEDDKPFENNSKSFNDRIHFVPEKTKNTTLQQIRSEESERKDSEFTK